ncbi:hypothetical protein JMUB5695_04013 [Mycobacterium heckeshornense]|uniref:hypothetical protein n=1 Tax=Mycobacterium heckeshornense TaxID=110505 RepID=UPI001940CF9F|nr:hypothetical protein [Mycobacterium heckeshornense]BCQ10555.1 hypothetical protein JMUB5695_04013 [Mycobacterium heckeshornense]
MIAVELLGHAQRVLTRADIGGLSARIAAFLARQALEHIVNQRCIALGVTAPYATTRSKLLILRTLDSSEVGDTAAFAWNRLSSACHVHAYEMQPSVVEIEQLCGVVASLLPQA